MEFVCESNIKDKNSGRLNLMVQPKKILKYCQKQGKMLLKY